MLPEKNKDDREIPLEISYRFSCYSRLLQIARQFQREYFSPNNDAHVPGRKDISQKFDNCRGTRGSGSRVRANSEVRG